MEYWHNRIEDRTDDRQIRIMREFLMADCKEAIAETQQELDEVARGGDEWLRKHLEHRLAELRASLQRWEAEAAAA
jgi:hypothetical protein